MNISARCQYACRAIVELARHAATDAPVAAAQIAERRQIPEKYLAHILLELKRAGLVRSVRGAQGGYCLGRPPESITLHDIVCAIDGPVLDPLPVPSEGGETLGPVWADVGARISDMLAGVTAADVAKRNDAPTMYYI